MQDRDIKRVCCLLAESQLVRYPNFLEVYRRTFGQERVCWSPIADFHLFDPEMLVCQILPFLAISYLLDEKVIVHCSGGIGRTGHILAAWLVAAREFSPKPAIAAVMQTGRNPYEAIIAAPFQGRNPWQVTTELKTLLEMCTRPIEDTNKLNREMSKTISLQKLLLKSPCVWLRLLGQRKQFRCSNFLVSMLNTMPAYFAEIEYYGVYEPNIEDATLTFIVFKPLEYLLESAIGFLCG
jgi:protein-tyrosine phosphatase